MKENSKDINFTLIAYGKDKTRTKVNISNSYAFKDDKCTKRLSQQELNEKAKEHAIYLLQDNFYAFNFYKTI